MRVVHDGVVSFVRMDVGEKLPDALADLAKAQGWRSGFLTGIGGVRDVVLAYYDLAARKYVTFAVEGIVELVSLSGNLSLLNDAPHWHLHAAVSDRDGNMKGGHLIGLTVAITLECWVHASSSTIERTRDELSGLNLLDLR